MNFVDPSGAAYIEFEYCKSGYFGIGSLCLAFGLDTETLDVTFSASAGLGAGSKVSLTVSSGGSPPISFTGYKGCIPFGKFAGGLAVSVNSAGASFGGCLGANLFAGGTFSATFNP